MIDKSLQEVLLRDLNEFEYKTRKVDWKIAIRNNFLTIICLFVMIVCEMKILSSMKFSFLEKIVYFYLGNEKTRLTNNKANIVLL